MNVLLLILTFARIRSVFAHAHIHCPVKTNANYSGFLDLDLPEIRQKMICSTLCLAECRAILGSSMFLTVTCEEAKFTAKPSGIQSRPKRPKVSCLKCPEEDSLPLKELFNPTWRRIECLRYSGKMKLQTDKSIAGHNDKVYKGIFMKQCIRRCVNHRGFTCKSIEFRKFRNICYLSKYAYNEVPKSERDGGEPNWTFGSRQCTKWNME